MFLYKKTIRICTSLSSLSELAILRSSMLFMENIKPKDNGSVLGCKGRDWVRVVEASQTVSRVRAWVITN